MLFAACQTDTDRSIQGEEHTESNNEAALTRSTSAQDAVAHIISPADGAVVPSGKVKVQFGLSGMGVAPAGIEFPNSGHHHLLINASELPPMDQPIPADSTHIHFGLGQTETTLELQPGTYTMQLVMGDYSHIPHDPPVISTPVTIIVE